MQCLVHNSRLVCIFLLPLGGTSFICVKRNPLDAIIVAVALIFDLISPTTSESLSALAVWHGSSEKSVASAFGQVL